MYKVGQVVVIKTKEEMEKDELIIPKQITKCLGKELYVKKMSINGDNETIYILETPEGKEIFKDSNNLFYFEECYISNNEPKIYKEIKVGDVIKFGEIKEYKKYGDIIASRYMTSFSDTFCIISNIDKDGTFQVSEDSKNYWYSRTMINKYQSNSDLNIGDEVYIFPIYKYDMGYKGRKAVIQFMEYNNLTNDYVYALDIDNGLQYWDREALIKKGDRELFDLDKLRDNNIVIYCNKRSEIEQLFKSLNSLGIKWCDGCLLDSNDFLLNCGFNKNGFTINSSNQLEYSSINWFKNREYNIIKFDDIIFDFLEEKADSFNPNVSKTITREYLKKNRGLCIGDIYKLEDDNLIQHNGWRIAMNGYSVGLNCDNFKSWGTLEAEEDMNITKMIPFDKDVRSYSNMSEFMKTFDESIMHDMIIKVI